MSLNAALIQVLVEKGLSAQDILDIAKASEVKLDRTAADRQARYRDRKKGKRNAVTSRRDPPIEEDHTPGSEISSDDETQNVARRDADWIEIPDWMPVKPWNGYLEMREQKKAWPTAYAVELIIGDLRKWRAKGHDPGAILNTSTVSKWTGIFEPKAPKNGQHPHPAKPTTRDIGERVAASFARAGDSAVDLLPGPRSACGNE